MNNKNKSDNVFTFDIVAEMLGNYKDMKRKAADM